MPGKNFSLNSVTSVVSAEDCKNLRIQENSKDIYSNTYNVFFPYIHISALSSTHTVYLQS